ncbi:glycosyltransferase family 1 protein [Pedobacter sp. MC2016-24]|uniref:glycosyltransferase family 4 protein n=1 Tax=Pedobacter sp. MC2016-24 TaxID=2780090 RepID=UPI00188158DF|nr:glycosyltransferase family 1 protein [Pedobacter sp. MC2016-24]MBE9602486.1 glycosyltransferase family 4 protein [Pedobacter sp. MC2016-24]
MIKVFFDHQKFTTQKYGGISRYFASIIQEIKNEPDFDYQLGLLYSDNHYIKDEYQAFNNAVGRKLSKTILGKRIYNLNEAYCTRLLRKNDFDIFHPTYYDPYFIKDLKKPMVTTIHDMTYERLPEYFWANDPLTYQKRINIEKADRIIAISETTKNDLLELSNVSEDKISVIYHGIDIDTPLVFQNIKSLPDQYILFVGDRSGYKNFYLFIEAFKEINFRFPEIKLVLSGGGTLGIADQELLIRNKLTNSVSHVQVTDEELNFLYQNAVLFVYPSLYEGFGLPILEAFKARCPVLLSDIDCFKEVAGDAAVFFSKHSKEDLIHQITSVLMHSNIRKELISKGAERIKLFPLADCIQHTLNLYKTLA